MLAIVRLEFTASEGSALHVERSPSVFSELSYHVDPAAPGFLAWRRGAEMGVRVGAELAGVSSGAVQIRSILGKFSDTTEGAVAGAAALALWDALQFDAPANARARVDEMAARHRYPFEPSDRM